MAEWDPAHVTGTISSIGARLRSDARHLRKEALSLETAATTLTARAGYLRRDANSLDSCADRLDDLWKEVP